MAYHIKKKIIQFLICLATEFRLAEFRFFGIKGRISYGGTHAVKTKVFFFEKKENVLKKTQIRFAITDLNIEEQFKFSIC
jgi:hypothetical protein